MLLARRKENGMKVEQKQIWPQHERRICNQPEHDLDHSINNRKHPIIYSDEILKTRPAASSSLALPGQVLNDAIPGVDLRWRRNVPEPEESELNRPHPPPTTSSKLELDQAAEECHDGVGAFVPSLLLCFLFHCLPFVLWM
jgi:hypothetical protein